MGKQTHIYAHKDGRYEYRIPIGRRPNGTLRYLSLHDRDKETLMRRRKEAEKLAPQVFP